MVRDALVVVVALTLGLALVSAATAGKGKGKKLKPPVQVTKAISAPPDFSSVEANCGNKGKAHAGGFRAPEYDGSGAAQPFQLGGGPDGKKWKARVYVGGVVNTPFEVRAYCVKDRPVKVRAETTVVDAGQSELSQKCRAGEVVVSGGLYNSTPDGVGLVFSSYKQGKRKWGGVVFNDTSDPTAIEASAICMKKSKAPKLKTRQKTVPISTATESLLAASCKRGERVFSGGFEADLAVGGVAYPTSSFRSSKRTWKMGAAVLSGSSGATAYAYCYKP